MKTSLLKATLLSAMVLLFTSAGNFLSAQINNFCATDKMMEEMLKMNPDAAKAREILEEFTREYVRTHTPETSAERGGPAYIIPVVFHIIHDRGSENITDAVVTGSIDLLNRDYQKLNPDTNQVYEGFKPLIGDANIEFRLAQIDPDGNCTNGIDRIYSYRTYQGNDRTKLGGWDRSNYLNIWVAQRIADQTAAAYAYLPSGAAGLGYKVDGVIAWYQYVGPTSQGPRTLTHEIGHYLNLSHVWGGGPVATACGDDGVDDTPVTEGGTSCPANKVDYTCDKDSVKRTIQFNNVTTTTGTTDPDSVVGVDPNNSLDTTVIFTSFTAVGVSANSDVNSAFGYSDWGTGGVDGDTVFNNHTGSMDLNKYYEFKVRPIGGHGMSMTGIRFWVRRNSKGPRTFAFRSSATTTPFSTNLTVGNAPANPNISLTAAGTNVFYFLNDTDAVVKSLRITLSGNAYNNTDKTITFRIYAWNAEDATGTFEIDSVAPLLTAGTIENVDNYMDYTYCHHMFTIGQTERMHAALQSNIAQRNNLWTAANHHVTGIDNPQLCAPQADFYVKKTMACQNTGSVQFFDYSSRGEVSSRLWTFPNGTPATDTSKNPVVTFNSLWDQSATLTVNNAAGSSTITKDHVVWVAPGWADYTGLFYEDFEDQARFNSVWRVENKYSTASNWEYTNSGYFPSGTHGLRLNAFSPMILSTNTTPQIILDWGIGGFDKDAFITPAFDLSHINAGTGKLEFKISAATRGTTTTDMTDSLTVRYSVDCGNTWRTLVSGGTMVGPAINNAGSWEGSYTPTVSTQWTQKTINLIGNPTPLAPNVRFKFEYTSGDMSNNIFIDDINISGTVGIEDNSPGASVDLMVFPNPSAGDVSVSYRIPATTEVKLQVFDALGNLVVDLLNQKQSPGGYSMSFSTSKMSNGVYYVKLTGDNVALRTEKVVVIR